MTSLSGVPPMTRIRRRAVRRARRLWWAQSLMLRRSPTTTPNTYSSPPELLVPHTIKMSIRCGLSSDDRSQVNIPLRERRMFAAHACDSVSRLANEGNDACREPSI